MNGLGSYGKSGCDGSSAGLHWQKGKVVSRISRVQEPGLQGKLQGAVVAVGAAEMSGSFVFFLDVLVEMEGTVQLPRVGVLNYVASAL